VESIPFDPAKETPDASLSYRQKISALNNFYCHFPIATTTAKGQPFLGLYRQLIEESNRWDITYRAAYAAPSTSKSNKRLNQTPRQFYDEIDAVVLMLGISMKDLSETIYNAVLVKPRPSDPNDPKWKRMWELLFPIYVELRKRGYSPLDLCQ